MTTTHREDGTARATGVLAFRILIWLFAFGVSFGPATRALPMALEWMWRSGVDRYEEMDAYGAAVQPYLLDVLSMMVVVMAVLIADRFAVLAGKTAG